MNTDEMLELSQEFAAITAELCGDARTSDAQSDEVERSAALQRMVELAVKHIDGCSWASVTVITRGIGRSVAVTDPVAQQADELQYALNEGPCLSAAENDANYLMFDVETETRWPRYAEALLAKTPVRSVLSFQLAAQESAALNLFADAPGAYDDEAIHAGAIFAAHATNLVALYEAQDTAANLESALNSNRRIGTAIGVLMAHHKVTEDVAFGMLRTASQRLHRKLRDIAVEVVETGALPD
ncbi:MAG TPA: GAF and ANTAR domain-containing protein [Jatrophihabitans sp.]|nr:GAF and ANTAR domain-containing protein [Jatrophihabitans sp.]